MRGLLAIPTIALVAGASPVFGAPSSRSDKEPVWSPSGKRIAFVSNRGGAEQIYVMNRDGGGLRRLTQNAGSKGNVAWSPAGNWIAYEVAPSYIQEVSSDGRRHRRLTDCCSGQPDFSPSGRKIVYADIGTQTILYVMQADGSDANPVQLPKDGDEALLAPTWSPSGRYLAFAIGSRGDAASGTLGLAIISAHGGARATLIPGHSIWSTDWSPNGRKLLLVENDGRIVVFDLRTRKLRSFRQKAPWHARWSPDGRKILYAFQGRIYVMNSDGSHVRVVVPHR